MMSLALLLTACGDGGTAAPDAGPDAPYLAGDWSCVGVERPNRASDPLALTGKLGNEAGALLGGASVEIHRNGDNALLGSTITADTNLSRGGYRVDVATGGVAPSIYRKFTATGYLDLYAIDPMPQTQTFSEYSAMVTQANVDALYQAVGMTPDPTKGVIAMQIYDCALPGSPLPVHPVAGATIDGPPGSTVLYANLAGQFDVVSIDRGETLASGMAVLLNVPPGVADITVHAGPVTYRPWPVEVFAGSTMWMPRHP
ncbi:MAG TPA: hypothetical protein VLB44_11890 [Kofleriaceae bacterium]|nr:hypothetical protein [Kofleriaceae bacterium]